MNSFVNRYSVALTSGLTDSDWILAGMRAKYRPCTHRMSPRSLLSKRGVSKGTLMYCVNYSVIC